MTSALWHYGVKGMKWGVRKNVCLIQNGVYKSRKGFECAAAKLTCFLLKEGAKHAQEFFDAGYSPDDPDQLFRHLENGFSETAKVVTETREAGFEKFQIPMKLGTTKPRMFTTAWQIDREGAAPRFITAYADRRIKEG